MLAANVQRAQHPTQQLQVINRPAYGALVPAYSAAATDLAAALPSVLNGPTPPAMCDIGAEILRVPDLPLQYIREALAQYELCRLAAREGGPQLMQPRDDSQCRALYLHILLHEQTRLREQKRCKVCASAPASKNLQVAAGVSWDITAHSICASCGRKAVSHLSSLLCQQRTDPEVLRRLFGIFVSGGAGMMKACLYPPLPDQLVLPRRHLQCQGLTTVPQEAMLQHRHPLMQLPPSQQRDCWRWRGAGVATPPFGSIAWFPGKPPPVSKAATGCVPLPQHGYCGALQSQLDSQLPLHLANPAKPVSLPGFQGEKLPASVPTPTRLMPWPKFDDHNADDASTPPMLPYPGCAYILDQQQSKSLFARIVEPLARANGIRLKSDRAKNHDPTSREACAVLECTR